ncbi:Inner membrane protein yijD [Kluyvera cryocrescens]|uniref:Inner membrane protein yijD n=1 Tax=Kluyvera cryocrescens TaxID=580 RepID=A0A485B4N2_KLUCR|nr:Inner membrane protein yijD [Kluyvera cryocrescens]
MKQSGQDKGTLLLALLAGLSINGTFAALFSSIVPFSRLSDNFSGADGVLSASTLSKPHDAGRITRPVSRLLYPGRVAL